MFLLLVNFAAAVFAAADSALGDFAAGAFALWDFLAGVFAGDFALGAFVAGDLAIAWYFENMNLSLSGRSHCRWVIN